MSKPLSIKETSVFIASKKTVLKKYPKAKADIENATAKVRKNPGLGDLFPGVGGHGTRKARFPLRAYNIGKRGGLRFIFFPTEKAIIPIHIYAKKEWRSEHEVIETVKAKLKLIIAELQEPPLLTKKHKRSFPDRIKSTHTAISLP